MKLQLPILNFPQTDFRIRESNARAVIYDPCRKKYVPLTPEEWVRQHCIYFLHSAKGIPLSMISVEKALNMHTQVLRSDIVAYAKSADPLLLVECKAPEVKITPAVFDQIAVYNLELKVPFLFVTNGIEHFFCQVDINTGRVVFLRDLPDYKAMSEVKGKK